MNVALTAPFFAVSGGRFFSLISKQQSEWTLEEQQQLCKSTWTHSITDRFPRNVTVRTQTLKRFVALLESRAVEVDDLLYEHLAFLMTLSDDNRDFHTYFVGEKRISVECHRSMVEQATTGLHSWPAGKQLAHFALENKAEFENKSVLELGSGTGLTGIVIASLCSPHEYLFTDHNESVLKLIANNVSLNAVNTKCSMHTLDWSLNAEAFTCEIGDTIPEVIVACDVVFDTSIVAQLCCLLSHLLNRYRCKALVMSTIRNRSTLESFEQQLHKEEMIFEKREIRGENVPPFYVDENDLFVLHEIKANKF